jgi:hypothetical protein
MEWRITFFVEEAEPTSDGWIVTGERGLGPPEAGDAFSFVHHEDDHSEDVAVLRVVEAAPDRLRLVTQDRLRLRQGDILGGEVDR